MNPQPLVIDFEVEDLNETYLDPKYFFMFNVVKSNGSPEIIWGARLREIYDGRYIFRVDFSNDVVEVRRFPNNVYKLRRNNGEIMMVRSVTLMGAGGGKKKKTKRRRKSKKRMKH
jgi:hypothetical protein